MVYNLIRIGIMFLTAGVGFWIGFIVSRIWIPEQALGVRWSVWGLSIIVAGLIGYAVSPRLIDWILQLTKWLETKLQKTPIQDIIGGSLGLIIGLIIANLFGVSFNRLPFIGTYLPIAASLILGYLGWSVGIKKREDILAALPNWSRFGKDKGKNDKKHQAGSAEFKILDTSVIIDGRIADICKSGFVEGALVVPGFVLEELRHIADSSDLLKRNRGRRGLDILNKLRKDNIAQVEIWEEDFEDLSEVDTKLVRLANVTNGKVLTNDYNLNKVAEVQGVSVLNINELANALKPVVLPGEEMDVKVIKDGKEPGQGVGYLDDGTMIVVENGRRFMGETIIVHVTSVLQTAAGRMIFAKPKIQDKKEGAQASAERGEYQWLT